LNIMNYIFYEIELFFFLIYLYVFMFLCFYVFTRFHIKSNKDILCKILGVDSSYIKNMKIEDVFIMTGNFGRLYLFYLLEIKILKKEEINFIFKNKLKFYIYPNLDNFNSIKLIRQFPVWFAFNFLFLLIPVVILLISLIMSYFYSNEFNLIFFSPVL
jgi:hypothetical protein